MQVDRHDTTFWTSFSWLSSKMLSFICKFDLRNPKLSLMLWNNPPTLAAKCITCVGWCRLNSSLVWSRSLKQNSFIQLKSLANANKTITPQIRIIRAQKDPFFAISWIQFNNVFDCTANQARSTGNKYFFRHFTIKTQCLQMKYYFKNHSMTIWRVAHFTQSFYVFVMNVLHWNAEDSLDVHVPIISQEAKKQERRQTSALIVLQCEQTLLPK